MLSRVFVASSLLLVLFASLAAGDLPGEIKGHTGFVYSVAFSPDGEILATGSVDKSVRIWNADNPKDAKSLGNHGASVYCVAFSPNGKLLASCAFDGTIKVWDLDGGKELKSFASGPEKGPKDGILQVAWA